MKTRTIELSKEQKEKIIKDLKPLSNEDLKHNFNEWYEGSYKTPYLEKNSSEYDQLFRSWLDDEIHDPFEGILEVENNYYSIFWIKRLLDFNEDDKIINTGGQ